MKHVMQYPNLQEALLFFKAQVLDSVKYCFDNTPKFDTPEELFNYLKIRTTYKNDPKGRELFQSSQTLFDNNYHGIVGAGDCDCFTLTCLACCIANDWYKIGIVLAGRSSIKPSHIYQYIDWKGTRYYMDLTNKIFNQTRYYPYTQEINFYAKRPVCVISNQTLSQ